jgi:hypothetical protein
MTQTATAQVHSQASIDIRSIVLPRATWATELASNGALRCTPQRGTWYGHVLRGRSRFDVTVLAMLGCPSCGGLLFLSHEPKAAAALRKMTGMPVPVAHRIDSLGRVSPDIRCQHAGCGFHRRVFLDRWHKTKPLFALAYINCDKGEHGEIEIAYSHSIDAREARGHLGKGNFKTIAAGPAVGFFVNEKTGRMTAEMA